MSRPLGPGPGAYGLPTTVGYDKHDGTRYRNPMYSFGMDTGYKAKAIGPGPTYKIERVTKEGVVSSPCWSFGARFPYRSSLRTPGPGAHAPEKCPPTKEPRAPCYSMGARLGYMVKKVGPASNAYAIRFGPDGPCYTMGSRCAYQAKNKSPGPAVYFQKDQAIYKTKAPCYSLGARLDHVKIVKSPGPANYLPLYNTKKYPACYSFGQKHADWAPPMIIDEDTMNCL